MEIEKLDVDNIIEIDRIRTILINQPDLLSMFELLVIISNKRLNSDTETKIKKIEDDSDEEIDVILDSDSE